MKSNTDLDLGEQEISEYLFEIYSTYFPDEIKGPVDKPVRVPCPFDTTSPHEMVIETDPIYHCDMCEKQGYPSTFISELELVPSDYVGRHIAELRRKLRRWENMPTMQEINKWSAELMSQKASRMRGILNDRYGIGDAVLAKRKIGYDAKQHALIFPSLNATGKGVSAVNFKEVDSVGDIGAESTPGGGLIFGLYEMRHSSDNTVILVGDALDALGILQQGYMAVSLMVSSMGWWGGLASAFAKKDVIVALGSLRELKAAKLSIITDLLPLASSVKDLAPFWDKNRVEFFKESGKTKADLDQAIKNLPKIEESKKDFLEAMAIVMQNQSRVFNLNPAQDFVDGKMFFGIKIGNVAAVINSAGEIDTLANMRQGGKFNITSEAPTSTNFSAAKITEYTLGNRNAEPAKIFEGIHSHLKKYVFLQDDNIYSVLTLWIMGTYIYRMFSSFPYLHVGAERGSGKTTLLEAMSDLAFNGKIFVGQTSATVFWEVGHNSSTLFLDEVEKLRGASKADLIAVLNSGYKKGATVPRKSGNNIVLYDIYSPKMFAGIDSISNTLSDRSIKLRMLKKLKTEKTSTYTKVKLVDDFIAQTRDDLYVFALTKGTEIATDYLDKLDTLKFLGGLENRSRERWTPLLIIADLVGDKKVMESAKEYLKQDEYLHKLEDTEGNIVGMVAGLKDLMKTTKPIKQDGTVSTYTTDVVFTFLRARPELKWLKTKNSLTTLLGQNGIGIKNEAIRGIGTKRCYLIDATRVDDLGVRYDVQV